MSSSVTAPISSDLSLVQPSSTEFGFSKNKQKLIGIFQETAAKYGMQILILSQGFVVRFTKGDLQRFIIGYTFEINSATAKRLCSDKPAAAALFKHEKIPHIENELFLRMEDKKRMHAFAKERNFDLVCKPTDGSKGKDVIHVQNFDQLDVAVDQLFKNLPTISLGRYEPLEFEYRVIILNDSAEDFFIKEKPHLVGDGTSTVEGLLAQYKTNCTPKQRKKMEKFESPNSLELYYIPKKDEIIYLHWKHNQHQGSSSLSFNPQGPFRTELTELARKAARSLGVVFASVDIVKTRQGLAIMEINEDAYLMEEDEQKGHPGYEKAKSIYEKAICLLMNITPTS